MSSRSRSTDEPVVPPQVTPAVSDEEHTTLMLQWVFWKHLAPELVLDGERMQRLAEKLAHAFFLDGVRIPLTNHAEETVVELQHELRMASKDLPPVPIPQHTLRERQKFVAERLFKMGWRKIATSAAAILLWELSASTLMATMT